MRKINPNRLFGLAIYTCPMICMTFPEPPACRRGALAGTVLRFGTIAPEVEWSTGYPQSMQRGAVFGVALW
jgi:hypothetical protein